MSEFASALGLSLTIKHAPWRRDDKGAVVRGADGQPERLPEKEFTLAPPDRLDVLGHWEQYLEDQAFQVIQKRYANNPMLLSIKEQELNQAIVAGDYGIFGQASGKAMTNTLGPAFRKFLFFCLRPYYPAEAEHLAEEIAADQKSQWLRMMRQAMDEAKPEANGKHDPNSIAPGLTGAAVSV